MSQNDRPAIVYQVPFDEPEDQKLVRIRKIFEEHPEVDGIFADNDTNARLALTAATEAGGGAQKTLRSLVLTAPI